MMGTGPFAVPTFQALHESKDHDVCLLVTRPPVVSRGRPAPASPMRLAGESMGIPIFDPPDINDAAAVERLHQCQADLLVVCDYGQILSTSALEATPLGGINLHGSLLPRYRGAAPVQWSVYHGDQTTGVSVIHMTPRLDGGPVLCRRTVSIAQDDTSETLEVHLSAIGVDAVFDALNQLTDWDRESDLGERQDPAAVTKAPRLKKAMGDIDWTRSAVAIRNQVRAFKPWPASFTQMERGNGKWQKVIVDWVEVVEDEPDTNEAEPGQVVEVGREHLWIQTGQGRLSIIRIQPVGKRVMEVSEFLRGYQPAIGTRFASLDG